MPAFPPPSLQWARSRLDRLANTYIGGATAKISAHRFLYIRVRGFRRGFQQRDRAHNLSALAVPALHNVKRDPHVLHGAANRVFRHRFKRDDWTLADERNGDHAGTRRGSAEMHGARAAGS